MVRMRSAVQSRAWAPELVQWIYEENFNYISYSRNYSRDIYSDDSNI